MGSRELVLVAGAVATGATCMIVVFGILNYFGIDFRND